MLTDAAEESDVEHFRWRVSKNLTRRIDQYLVDRVRYLSRNGVQRLIDEGLVKVNGKPTKASYKLKARRRRSTMVAPPEPVNELVPEDIPLDIVYEDEHFLALNKQADLIVHPARGRWTRHARQRPASTTASKWSNVNGDWRPGILHRLDRNTTGIMLVAKSDEAHWRIARQFENRTIQKTYVAVCHGVPELLGDVIDMPDRQGPLRPREAGRPQGRERRQAGGHEVRGAGDSSSAGRRRVSCTSSTFAHDQQAPARRRSGSRFVKLTPKTGRTHQFRVHMAAIGHPMVGDTMYGGRIFEHGRLPLRAAGPARVRDHVRPPGDAGDDDAPGPAAAGHDAAGRNPRREERLTLHGHPEVLRRMLGAPTNNSRPEILRCAQDDEPHGRVSAAH